jgi:hypothetical protein
VRLALVFCLIPLAVLAAAATAPDDLSSLRARSGPTAVTAAMVHRDAATLAPASVPKAFRVCQALHAGLINSPSPEVAADLRSTCLAAAVENPYGPCHTYAAAASDLGQEPDSVTRREVASAALAACATQ